MTVREARKKEKCTQEKLANKCGVSREAIANIETGRTMPSVALAQRIGKALHTKWWLFYPDYTAQAKETDEANR